VRIREEALAADVLDIQNPAEAKDAAEVVPVVDEGVQPMEEVTDVVPVSKNVLFDVLVFNAEQANGKRYKKLRPGCDSCQVNLDDEQPVFFLTLDNSTFRLRNENGVFSLEGAGLHYLEVDGSTVGVFIQPSADQEVLVMPCGAEDYKEDYKVAPEVLAEQPGRLTIISVDEDGDCQPYLSVQSRGGYVEVGGAPFNAQLHGKYVFFTPQDDEEEGCDFVLDGFGLHLVSFIGTKQHVLVMPRTEPRVLKAESAGKRRRR
jgi:hypothetical protein